MENENKTREKEILRQLCAIRREEHLPELQTGNNPDYNARQDILDWIESQGIYIRE